MNWIDVGQTLDGHGGLANWPWPDYKEGETVAAWHPDWQWHPTVPSTGIKVGSWGDGGYFERDDISGEVVPAIQPLKALRLPPL